MAEEKKLYPIVEHYNTSEEYLYSKTYIFIKGYAVGAGLPNTLKALPLARKLHDGQYRKGLFEVDGKQVQLPYILHPLKVCSTLLSLNIPMPKEDLDILYSCALLHDTLEDASDSLNNNADTFREAYGFPKEVGDTIRLLSKRTGADQYELNAYFNALKKNRFALLIKLSDRSHNVEDLYNMRNIPKYIKETKEYFLASDGICAYGKQNYPELSNAITIMKAKILSLTEATEAVMARQASAVEEKEKEIEKLKEKLKEKENCITDLENRLMLAEASLA